MSPRLVSEPGRRAPHVRFGRTVIAAQVVAAIAFAGYLLAHEGVRLPFGKSPYRLEVQFADAAGLATQNHSPVTVAGVPEGRVESVSYSDGVAVARLELNSAVAGTLRRGATARIVPRSALQDLTVEVDPGGRGDALPSGSTIPAARTSSPVGSDRVLDVLDADTRAQLSVLLGQLANGLDGRAGAIRGDLSELARTVDSAGRVTRQLNERRALLAKMVDELDAIFRALDERQAQLGGAIEAGRQTVEVTGAHREDIGQSLRELPGALAATNRALAGVQNLAKPLDPALAELGPFADRLPAALQSLRSFTPAGEALLADVDRLAARAGAPVATLDDVLHELGPTASALREPAAKVTPIVRAVDRHREGIGELGDRFSGVFSTNDANGPILRGLGFFEPFNPTDLGFQANSKASVHAAKLETVKALTRVCLQSNPVACLVRYLVPSLPGAVAGAEDASP